MSDDQALSLAATLGAMTLVASALLVRHVPMRTAGRLALIWFAIFAAAILIVRLSPSITMCFT